ncbi:helix-turn-helix domain-containing protein [Aminipila terrae]|uniref:Helix-turn-helix domain-containing protein n=1 Tax=Aminipila terrae TaxID=2697030 RepID=A0A6P1MDV7_9FIRM|nr:helix-turn-helix transcriptional regulator [Aminipila terrae]QHI72869.1 helix-turn-helix domain-containing protein [Aminipila terrae]
MTNEELSRLSGVPLGTLNKIFAGQTTDPKFETVKALCSALGISLSELDNFESNNQDNASNYYLDPEAAEIAQEIYEDKDLRMLFDASRKVSKSDIQLVIDMVKRLKGDE